MQPLIIVLLCLINLGLWVIFFIKFKKLFSTDDVIQKTRDQYDLLLSDINRNALQNIDLIQMKIDELQELIEIADRRLSTIEKEQEFVNRKTHLNSGKTQRSTQRKNNKEENIAADVVSQNQAFELDFDLKKVKRKVNKTDRQEDLPNIYVSSNPIQMQKSFQDQVERLYDLGYSIDQIAHELNKSTTEVELIVEML